LISKQSDFHKILCIKIGCSMIVILQPFFIGAKMLEKEIEKAILEYLNTLPETKAWKNQSVGVYDPKKKVYRLNKGAFTARGSSDILGICQGVMLCIEVKTAKGRLSEAQEKFLDDMANLGALAFVARSVDDVRKTLLEVHLIDW